MRQCFEFVGGSHRKFWSVEVVGCHYLATYGRIGTTGQTQVKTFYAASEAERKAREMIDEKTGKGYTRVTDNAHPGASATLLASLGASPAQSPSVRRQPVMETVKTSRQINLDE